VLSSIACALFGATVASAQGRGGGAWTTTGGDAQRTASVRTDPRITKESVAKNFQLLWKRTLESPSKQPNALTQPVLLPNIISYKGFKALAFFGGAADNVYALDYDLSRVFWQRHLESGGAPAAPTASCPGGLTTVTRSTPLAVPTGGGRGGRGQQPPGPGTPPAAGQGGRAAGPPPAPPSPPMPGSGPGPNAVLGGVAGGRGGNPNVYAISSGGKLHALNPQDGTDMVPPIPFLPANANAFGSILIESSLYAATTGNCGGAPNGVWAIELADDSYAVSKWETTTPVAGDGPAFGSDGTIYIAAGDSIVSLDRKTLKEKARFTPGNAPFTSSPVVFQSKGRTLVAAANKDGRVYLTDGSKALASSAPLSGGNGQIAGLAVWEEGSSRWLLASVQGPLQSGAVPGAPANAPAGSIVAFKVADEGDMPTLQPVWASRDLMRPVTPLVINGVVFALASGSDPRESRVRPAVLYALDATTGKDLWNSGDAISSPVRGVGPSGGDGQVYVVTPDGTIYTFGIPVER